MKSQHQWRGEKRVLSRAPSRGGSTRGVPSAVIATRERGRALCISVLNSRGAGSLVMSKACSMPQAHATAGKLNAGWPACIPVSP